ncbi:OsmC family protein [Bradyrhizobium sp. WSM1253]|uniref:OsmC family protein n=1 Tax=Bradyrhizobium sp. WSM1253 TaxID=319003 RepID=UPI00025D171D|nr:OsmC family protein [Bradyrhizobium sp. WSM1253]EIG57806.1 putative redox protein, regulator of disulfide bond formation [Bradyrhizobium sp. WSM1253]
MSSQTAETVSITSATLGHFGRYLLSARTNHFISDQRVAVGGPGEAINAGELLLSSLGSCSLGLIQKTAKEQGIRLHEAGSEVSFRRHATDPTQYEWIRIVVRLSGVTAGEAERLVTGFTANCPIYNTLKRGGPVEISWTVS